MGIPSGGKAGLLSSAADAGALFLIFATPFASYLTHYEYPLWSPAALGVMLAFAALASLLSGLVSIAPRYFRPIVYSFACLAFLDFQFDIIDWRMSLAAAALLACGAACFVLGRNCWKVFGSVFAVMLASTVIEFGVAGQVHRGEQAIADETPAMLPAVLHIVLDEHIGIAGIPTDIPEGVEVRDRLIHLFLDRGFRLFGRAYGSFVDTYNSLSSTFNFAAAPIDDRSVRFSRYFSELAARGYNIRVLQSTFMDFCAVGDPGVQTCATYDYNSLRPLKEWPASDFEKALLIVRSYSGLSHIFLRLGLIYDARHLHEETADVPSSGLAPLKVTSLAGFDALTQTSSEVMRLRPGTAVVSHVLLPHYPYAFMPDCSLRDVWSWKSRLPGFGAGRKNTSATRRVRYGDYLDQLKCLSSRLADLFELMDRENLWRNTIVIIHGDHGSRIVEAAAKIDLAALPKMSERDFFDAFSTLFAVRMPGLPGGYDDRMLPVEELLRRVVLEPRVLATAAPGDRNPEPRIYLREPGTTTFQAVKMPLLPSALPAG